MKRILSALLGLLCLFNISIALAEEAPVPQDESPIQQALQDQAAVNPTSPQIHSAMFNQAEAFMSSSEVIDMTATLTNLTVGEMYTVSAMLKGGNGGYVASGQQNPQTSQSIAATSDTETCQLHFTVDTTQYPGQHWRAALVLSDAAGQVISTYNGSMTPVAVVEPVIESDVSQGDVEGTLVVSFTASVSNIAPNMEYTLTGSLSQDDSNAPFRVNGEAMTASAPISLTVSDTQIGVPASAEITLKVPMSQVERINLIPMLTLSQGDSIIAQRRTAPISFGAVQTWSPVESTEEDYGEEVRAPQATAVSTVAPLETQAPPAQEALATIAREDYEEDQRILGPEGQQTEEKDNTLSLIVGLAVVGLVSAAALLIWYRYKRNQRSW